MTDSVTVQRVKRLMEMRGFTGAYVAEQIGISPAALSLLLSGKNSQPRMDTLVGLARVLGVSVDYLAGTTDDPRLHSSEPLPEYALEILEKLEGLDRASSYELLRVVEAFVDAQRESRKLQKSDLAAMLLQVGGQITSQQEAEEVAATLLALENGQRGVALSLTGAAAGD